MNLIPKQQIRITETRSIRYRNLTVIEAPDGNYWKVKSDDLGMDAHFVVIGQGFEPIKQLQKKVQHALNLLSMIAYEIRENSFEVYVGTLAFEFIVQLSALESRQSRR